MPTRSARHCTTTAERPFVAPLHCSSRWAITWSTASPRRCRTATSGDGSRRSGAPTWACPYSGSRPSSGARSPTTTSSRSTALRSTSPATSAPSTTPWPSLPQSSSAAPSNSGGPTAGTCCSRRHSPSRRLRSGRSPTTPDAPMAPMVRAAAFVPFTPAFNSSGQPAINLPLHWNRAGLPIGVQLVAAYGREDVLIRVAAQLEAAQPWAHLHPPAANFDGPAPSVPVV